MKSTAFKIAIITLIVTFGLPLLESPVATGAISVAQAAWKDGPKHQGKSDRKHNKKKHYKKSGHHYEYRNGHKLIVVAPRRRHYKHVTVIRPHGHVYWGYGHHHSDNDAWKWLAFTAISLKILDNINEQAQREHEAAQVRATEARVGEKIFWNSGDARGYVVTTREGRSDTGRSCREFQQSITIDGKTEQAYGTACLQPDGSWEVSP